ncbi:hypothetical protein [Polyangium aurulentum]|uniref:hypothetical protein n=1 Tax=Polyangium aurulentum TaxID=2567896 RepID=UPI0010ADF29E|nr:hypothetical protein [Polyangium aurulentum]UQA59187.1 hypothetical protein E8A73_001320 [Polyangium aurulentum]
MPRWTGLVLLFALVLHALVVKMPSGLLPEMLFACHIASVVLALGILLRRRDLVAVGFWFHAGVGLWGCLLDAIAAGTTTPTSVLVHVLPLVIGYGELKHREVPRWIPLGAFGLLVGAIVLSYLVTPPTLNVNMAHRVWPPVARIVPSLWASWAANLVLACVLLLVADRLLRRILA